MLLYPEESEMYAIWRESGAHDGETSRKRMVPGVNRRGVPPPAETTKMSEFSRRSSFDNDGSATYSSDFPSGDHASSEASSSTRVCVTLVSRSITMTCARFPIRRL